MRNIFSILILFFLCFGILNCEQKIFIAELKYLTDIYGGDYKHRHEYFIIFNAPNDIFTMADLLAEYNNATLTEDEIRLYRYYSRRFHKASSQLIDLYRNPKKYNKDLMIKTFEEDRGRLAITSWMVNNDGHIEANYASIGNSWTLLKAEKDEIFYPWNGKDSYQSK